MRMYMHVHRYHRQQQPCDRTRRLRMSDRVEEANNSSESEYAHEVITHIQMTEPIVHFGRTRVRYTVELRSGSPSSHQSLRPTYLPMQVG